MADSIFEGTMADMTSPQLKSFVQENPEAPVLLPLGVIEAHGPHLCLGTDIYCAYTYCKLIQKKLVMRSVASIIAPPFYWGMNVATEAFVGSFNSRIDVVSECVYDIVSSLGKFGFRNIYGLNAHGDPAQHKALLGAFKMACERDSLNARYILNPPLVPEQYGMDGKESYILPIAPKTVETSWSQYESNELHAGGRETAVMLEHHPTFVDLELTKTLPPVILTDEEIGKWVNGVDTVKHTPDVYVGAPADYMLHDAATQTHDVAIRVADAIMELIKRR